MNSKLSLLFQRRSVRKYLAKDVPEKMVTDLLEAAMAAPSAACKDPWHFVLVRDKALLGRISAELPNGPMLADAAVGIVVCGDIDKAHDRQESYMLQDCSAAIENMLIAASTMGLGACWLGVHPRKDRMAHVTRTLGLPPSIVPVSIISVGWPAQTPEPRTRYSGSAVHRDKW